MKFALCLIASALGSCPSSLHPGEHLITTSVGGQTREFYVLVPHNMPAEPSPGLVMVHGCGSSPEKFEMESQMNTNAAERKYFNVFPKGTQRNGATTRLGWNAGSSTCDTGGTPPDVDFMRAVVLYMVENLCIDVDRIFAAGFSNGASMTYNMSCTMSDTFAGFSGTGSSMSSAFYPENCGAKETKPFLMICGSADGCARSEEAWFDQYSTLSKCADPATAITKSITTTCKKHSRCGVKNAEPVESCMIAGLGHCWSGNDCCDSQCSGQNPANLDSSAFLLDWFSNLPKRNTGRTPVTVAQSLRHDLGNPTVFFNHSSSKSKSHW